MLNHILGIDSLFWEILIDKVLIVVFFHDVRKTSWSFDFFPHRQNFVLIFRIEFTELPSSPFLSTPSTSQCGRHISINPSLQVDTSRCLHSPVHIDLKVAFYYKVPSFLACGCTRWPAGRGVRRRWSWCSRRSGARTGTRPCRCPPSSAAPSSSSCRTRGLKLIRCQIRIC